MRKILFIAIGFIAFNAQAQNVGIGTTTPLQKLDVRGNQYLKDSLGIGMSSPHAPIQMANNSGRKIVLYEDVNNDHQYYGLAIDPSTFRFQTGGDYAFFRAATSTSSAELFRIKSNGNIGIGTNNPQQKLDVNGNVSITGSLIAQGSLSTQGSLAAQGSVTTQGTLSGTNLSVTGLVTSFDVFASNNISASGDIAAAGNISATGNISTTGNFMAGLEYDFHDLTLNGNFYADVVCPCSTGKKAIGGGGGHRDYNSALTDISVHFTGPTDDGGGWHVLVRNNSSSSRVIRVWAICAKMQ